MSVIKYITLLAGLLLALVLALIGVLSVTRDTPVKSVLAEGDTNGPPSVSDSLFPRSIELYTGTHIDAANKVEVLLNGNGTYPTLWRDLANAQHTITVQMYYSQPGAVADSLAKYLSLKARAHVRVLLLLDAFGSQPLKPEWLQGLKHAGVEVVWLRPLRWYTLNKAAQRSHVRAVVIDGRIGYTGGFGLADYWLGDGHHEDQWRESNVRFEGPTVAAPTARAVRFYVASGLLDHPEGTGTGATYGYRHLLQLLSIKIRQREGQSLEAIKSEMKDLTGDALEKRIAQSLAPALGAGAHAVAASDDDAALRWRRFPVANGIEIHVREDSPAAADDAVIAMREAVRSALGREDLR